MTPAEDALVAARFPALWARANSKKRNQLRRRYRDEQAMAKLRAEGARCANCKHIAGAPVGMTGEICEAHSDFYGYVTVKPDWLCLSFKRDADAK